MSKNTWCIEKCSERDGSELIVWDKVQRRSPRRRPEEWTGHYNNSVLQKWLRQITCSWIELDVFFIKLIRRVIDNYIHISGSNTLASKSYPGNSHGFSADFTGFEQHNREVEFSLKVRQWMQKSRLRKKIQKKNCWYVSSLTRRSVSKWPLPLFCLIAYLHGGKRKFPRMHDR